MSIPVDHPVVRAAALEMARERWDAMQAEYVLLFPGTGSAAPWDSAPSYKKQSDIQIHARMLTDLSRPASRDWWVRWLDKIDASYRSEQGRYDLDALRDNPTALTAAVLAALDSVAEGKP